MIKVNQNYNSDKDKTAINRYHFNDLMPGDVFTLKDPVGLNLRLYIKIQHNEDATGYAVRLTDWRVVAMHEYAEVWKYEGEVQLDFDMHNFANTYKTLPPLRFNSNI